MVRRGRVDRGLAVELSRAAREAKFILLDAEDPIEAVELDGAETEGPDDDDI